MTIIRSQKPFETAVGFSSTKTIESMDRLAIVKGQRLVETTVEFSIKKT